MIDRLLVAADHHAIAALEAPDAARRADIDIVDALLGQRLGAADVVLVEGVAAVDDDVVRLEQRAERATVSSVIRPAGSITQTARGGSSSLTELLQRPAAGGALLGQRVATASALRSKTTQ